MDRPSVGDSGMDSAGSKREATYLTTSFQIYSKVRPDLVAELFNPWCTNQC